MKNRMNPTGTVCRPAGHKIFVWTLRNKTKNLYDINIQKMSSLDKIVQTSFYFLFNRRFRHYHCTMLCQPWKNVLVETKFYRIIFHITKKRNCTYGSIFLIKIVIFTKLDHTMM